MKSDKRTNNLCIIPARGGSKRIPRKNIKEFFGKPIIAYSIETAVKSRLFDEIMVSTDDDDIAQIARSWGAKVPFFRSSESSNDFATTMQVIKEVVERYGELGKQFDYLCCFYPVAPLAKPLHIKKGFSTLVENQMSVVFPAVAFSYPVLRGVIRNEKGKVEMAFPDHMNSRSQDLPKVYHDAGQWYFLKPKALENTMFSNAQFIELSEMEAQDVDTPEDWRMLECKYRCFSNKEYKCGEYHNEKNNE